MPPVIDLGPSPPAQGGRTAIQPGGGTVIRIDESRWGRRPATRRAASATVLLALGEEPPEPAVSVAAQLAEGLDAHVAVLDLGLGGWPAAYPIDQLRERGVHAAPVSLPHGRDERIRLARAAWRSHADVVVVARHTGGLLARPRSRLLVGRLLAGWRPVLLVPAVPSVGWRRRPMLDRVVVPVGDIGSTMRAASWAATLVRPSSGAVVLVDEPVPTGRRSRPVRPAGGVDAERRRWETESWAVLLRRAGVDTRVATARGPVIERIREGVRRSGAGLVAVGARSRPLLDTLLRDGLGERVLETTSAPVLIVP